MDINDAKSMKSQWRVGHASMLTYQMHLGWWQTHIITGIADS